MRRILVEVAHGLRPGPRPELAQYRLNGSKMIRSYEKGVIFVVLLPRYDRISLVTLKMFEPKFGSRGPASASFSRWQHSRSLACPRSLGWTLCRPATERSGPGLATSIYARLFSP